MILKYYEGLNVADKTRYINYIDLSKVAQVRVVHTRIGDLDKYTFSLDGIDSSGLSHIFAANGSCVHYYFDSREEVERLIDDILYCHLTNKAYIYDIDENIRKLHLNCSGRNCISNKNMWY